MYEGTPYAATLHSSDSVQRPDAYVGLSRWRGTDHGRQGKRPAFGAAHVVGNIEEFVNANDTRCWRFSQIAERNQYSERHRPETHCGFGP